jgi:MFS family permease
MMTQRTEARTAVKFIVLLGSVSLAADMTYEGARSITGPFLGVLGASGTVVGLVAGFGELAGYGLRLASGYLSDRTGRYWAITIFGYALNLLVVPLLALAGHWQIAGGLIIAERLGKAIRTPARDAMLSHATATVGRGWGFGLHEALDQVGAVLGPLAIAWVLLAGGSFRSGFALLLVPAAIALVLLGAARFLYPHPRGLEAAELKVEARGFRPPFWIYLTAAGLVGAGYVDFPLIAFHLTRQSVVTGSMIPIFYALAMGVDGISAIVFGRLFDRLGIRVLLPVVGLSLAFAPLVFLGGFTLALVGMGTWGIGLGAQESIMRAAVAEMVPADRRGSAYGVFNSVYGAAWFLGSALMGFLYDTSVLALVVFSVFVQLASLPFFALTVRRLRSAP